MKRCITKHALLTAVAVLCAGCQQPTGPGSAMPLSPGIPLNSNTRVPPPPTGHIGAPNPYVQGQASTAASPSGFVASATASQPPVNEKADSASSDSPLRTVSYVESSSLGPAMPTPTIPAEAFVGDLPPRGDDVPLRPHLRGMQPIDLVPVQQAPNPAGAPAASSTASSVSAGTSASTDGAYRADSRPATSDSWAGAESTGPTTEPRPAADSGAADATSGAATPSVGDTQSVGDTLPWRKPSTAR